MGKRCLRGTARLALPGHGRPAGEASDEEPGAAFLSPRMCPVARSRIIRLADASPIPISVAVAVERGGAAEMGAEHLEPSATISIFDGRGTADAP